MSTLTTARIENSLLDWTAQQEDGSPIDVHSETTGISGIDGIKDSEVELHGDAVVQATQATLRKRYVLTNYFISSNLVGLSIGVFATAVLMGNVSVALTSLIFGLFALNMYLTVKRDVKKILHV